MNASLDCLHGASRTMKRQISARRVALARCNGPIRSVTLHRKQPFCVNDARNNSFHPENIAASRRLTRSLLKATAVAGCVTVATAAVPVATQLSGGSGGGGGFGGWGNFGPDWGNFLLAHAASDDEDEDEDETEEESEEEPAPAATSQPAKKPKVQQRSGDNICVEVVFEGYPTFTEGFAYPTKEELLLSLNTQTGYIFDEHDLAEDRRNLALDVARSGLAWNVKIRTEHVDGDTNNQRVIFKFENPVERSQIASLGILNANMMPVHIQETILTKFQQQLDHGELQQEVLAHLVATVRAWYDKEGIPFVVCDDICIDDAYGMAYINIQEGGRIKGVDVRYYKEGPDGNEISYSEGEVMPRDEVLRRVRLKPGDIYNNDDAMRTLNDIYGTGLLSDVRVAPEGDVFNPQGITFKIQAYEDIPNFVEVEADWAFELKPLPTVPRLGDLVPGGAVSLSRSNVFGRGERIDFTISADNLLFPGSNIGFEFEYHEPWYKYNAERFFSVFEQSKLSPVFTPGPDGAASGNVIVDRFGSKLWTYHHIPPGNSRYSHALMLQRVLTMDEMGYPTPQADRFKRISPRTTLSGTAMDISLSYQGYVTIDDTFFIAGELLGDRFTAQVDQGLGIGGLYNRHQLSWSKFRALDDNYMFDQPSKTLVLHAKAANTVGELPPYEYLTLGGPYSVRGYNVGELGVCKRLVEAAAELRYPLHKYGLPKGYALFGFAEYGTDLGSSRTLEEAPGLFYRKPGKGGSWGAGLRFQGCRLEYARDLNQGKGAWHIHWGERF